MKRRHIVIAFIISIMLGYIAWTFIAHKISSSNPNHDLSMEAVAEVFTLIQEGNLPGIQRGEKVKLKESGYVLSKKTVEYPVRRTFEVQKTTNDDGYTYKYILQKSAADKKWLLTTAWKENNQGLRISFSVGHSSPGFSVSEEKSAKPW